MGKNRYGSAQHVGLNAAQPVAPLYAIEATEVAHASGIEELDRVLGGGIVEGAVVLIGATGHRQIHPVAAGAGCAAPRRPAHLYVTGEESGAQVALRSRRLGLHQSQVNVLAEIQLENTGHSGGPQPAVAVIDSIQTVYSDQLTSAPGLGGPGA